jgi:hypothetical protein
MENMINIPTATAESFWAALHALRESQEQTNLQMAETNLQMAETSRKMAETDRRMAETDRQITRMEKQTGGLSNNHGAFAEEFFINSLEQREKLLFGEKFDKLIKSKIVEDDTNRTKGEFDIMLVNGKSVAIVEVKFRARDKHVDMVLKKIKPFRERFPEYQNHKVYLGLASLIFDEYIEDKCKENGIAVIKQVGDTVVIHDENLKTFFFFFLYFTINTSVV